MESIRIDKWLWAARLFKTRTQAAEACARGKIKIQGTRVKPSREIKSGEKIDIQFPMIHKTIQVKQIVKNRVSPKLVLEVMTDLTPTEEIEKLEFYKQMNYEKRDRGTGRPTKKDRRLLKDLKDSELE